MPKLSKTVISMYLRTGCRRQLALNLYNPSERRIQGMPPALLVQSTGLAACAGYRWQEEKAEQLRRVCGGHNVIVGPVDRQGRIGRTELATVISMLDQVQFVLEPGLDVSQGNFQRRLGIDRLLDHYGSSVDIGDLAPDAIQIVPPIGGLPGDQLDVGAVPDPMLQEVLSDGSVQLMEPDDPRVRLRVIDFKMSSEPGSHYFAEAAFYSMALASWLKDNGHDGRFAVSAAAGIWSVADDGGALGALLDVLGDGQVGDPIRIAEAVNQDVEVAPYEVFASRLRRFFTGELPEVVALRWDQQAWHVSPVCGTCDFLGNPEESRSTRGPQPGNQHCWQLGINTDHLCQLADVSRSGAAALASTYRTVSELANASMEDEVFSSSPGLRARRHLLPARARSLVDREGVSVEGAGTSATMPQWPDLHIYLFLEYDLSTALTGAMGVQAFWMKPRVYGARNDQPRERLRWGGGGVNQVPGHREVLLVKERSVEAEGRTLMGYLRSIREIMRQVIEEDAQGGRNKSRYQIYIWDEAQRRQLTRLLGRHLATILEDPEIRDLAWLFPPPELLTRADDVGRTGPLTLVSEVVANTVAAPVRYHYTLLDLARVYRRGEPSIPLRPENRRSLSDLVPADRLYEMWGREDGQDVGQLEVAVSFKLRALRDVVSRLEDDLRNRLDRYAAPVVGLPGGQSDRIRLPLSSRLWLEYQRLNAATQELEADMVRAMPPHEKEARFKSARLTERLDGDAWQDAFDAMNAETPLTCRNEKNLEIYRLAETSVDFNAKAGDLGYALVPENQPSFLIRHTDSLLKEYGYIPTRRDRKEGRVGDLTLTGCSIAGIDRSNLLIALELSDFSDVHKLEWHGVVDLSRDVVLDYVPFDSSVPAINRAIEAIGDPESSKGDAGIGLALGDRGGQSRGSGAGGESSVAESGASEFLWLAGSLANQNCELGGDEERDLLEGAGVGLNESQWAAWEHALHHRVSLIWGPPGTGKTKTLGAVTVGALAKAHREGKRLRVLLTAATYTALDTLLAEILDLVGCVLPEGVCRFHRLRSVNASQANWPKHQVADVAVGFDGGDKEMKDVLQDIESSKGLTVVASLPTRLDYLPRRNNSNNREQLQSWFDLTVVDEATQLGAALSPVWASKAEIGGTFVLGGDDLQLAPIQQGEPPANLEAMVGSVYSHLRHHHSVKPKPLQVNYRANSTLVEFTKRAGYDRGLTSHSPELRVRFRDGGFPSERPSNWPDGLRWSPGLVELLAAHEPAVCFVYDDPTAGQANPFESEVVAGLAWLLRDRLLDGLSGDLEPDGEPREVYDILHDVPSFWSRALGIVAPHRAQIASITSHLLDAFDGEDDTKHIRAAVDTVERFQGQQRDVIIASFGIGDPDVIAGEEEFIYNLNRFNVMASRARAKLVVLATRGLVDHLPKDLEVMRQSRLVKCYVEEFCRDPRRLELFGRVGELRSAVGEQ